MAGLVECKVNSPAWRNAYPQFTTLVDRFLLPFSVHAQRDNVVKSIAVSYMRQTGKFLTPAESLVLAEDAQEMTVDVMCMALSNQPDVRSGLSSKAALEGHVEEVKTMLASFPDGSSKEKIIAVAEVTKAYLELQNQKIFDPNDPRAIEALRPGIDHLAKAIELSEKEGNRRPAIFIPFISPSLEFSHK